MYDVLDYSAGPPAPFFIGQAAKGVMRYLPKRNATVVKVLTKSEYIGLRSRNIAVGFVGEDTNARRPLDGEQAGIDDAIWYRGTLDAMGIAFRCIYAAYDYNLSDAVSLARSAAYARGWHDVLGGRAGAYGFRPVLETIHSRRLASYYWLAGTRVALPWIALYQRNNDHTTVDGITCDINDQWHSDYGQNGMNIMAGMERMHVDNALGRAWYSFTSNAQSAIIGDLYVSLRPLWAACKDIKLVWLNDAGFQVGTTMNIPEVPQNARYPHGLRSPDGATGITLEWTPNPALVVDPFVEYTTK